MKRLSLYLFLILFTLQTPSFADDIRDFQIEGMSVGDSLLNHFSEKKIIQEINSKWSLDYGNKFIQIGVGEGKNYSLSKKIEIYDSVSVVLKLNDKNYIIYSLAGRITCKPLEECHTIKKNIVFRSIVIPYIKSTIIVVGTYMVVTVLKAFDIIYVSTRGDLETNLLAVKMLDEFSKYRNFGRSATVAVLIFVCVLPIIIGTAIREKENTQS